MYSATEKERQVAAVVAEVLEKQAFMFAEPSSELESEGTRFLHAQMGFSGPVVGDLEVVAPWELCATLAANALGVEMEDESAGQLAGDTFMEFLNVTCGQLLTALYGTGEEFWLSPPRVNELDAAGWAQAGQRPGGVGLRVDEWPVVIFLEVER